MVLRKGSIPTIFTKQQNEKLMQYISIFINFMLYFLSLFILFIILPLFILLIY